MRTTPDPHDVGLTKMEVFGDPPCPGEAYHEIHGAWGPNDLRRAFVAGAKWWEFRSTGATMWSSDRADCEAEAERRYGTGLFAVGTEVPLSTETIVEYGVCEHGKAIHFHYPCRRCVGWWLWFTLTVNRWRDSAPHCWLAFRHHKFGERRVLPSGRNTARDCTRCRWTSYQFNTRI